jgi:hypothetical protein
LVAKIPDNFAAAERQLRRIRLVDAGTERIVAEVASETGERLAFDPAYAVRMVADIVPNAWIARETVSLLKIVHHLDGRMREVVAVERWVMLKTLRFPCAWCGSFVAPNG